VSNPVTEARDAEYSTLTGTIAFLWTYSKRTKSHSKAKILVAP